MADVADGHSVDPAAEQREQDLARLLEEVVAVQRCWTEARAAWDADPTDRGGLEAFTVVGLELYQHPYWKAGGGNRFEAERTVRNLARPS